MTDHLHAAREYLALIGHQTEEKRADMAQLAVAHALVGILGHLTDENPPVKDDTDSTPDAPLRRCILCGRAGHRRFEETPAGLICSHYGQCAVRREENAT